MTRHDTGGGVSPTLREHRVQALLRCATRADGLRTESRSAGDVRQPTCQGCKGTHSNPDPWTVWLQGFPVPPHAMPALSVALAHTKAALVPPHSHEHACPPHHLTLICLPFQSVLLSAFLAFTASRWFIILDAYPRRELLLISGRWTDFCGTKLRGPLPLKNCHGGSRRHLPFVAIDVPQSKTELKTCLTMHDCGAPGAEGPFFCTITASLTAPCVPKIFLHSISVTSA